MTMNAEMLSFEVENFKSFEKSRILLSPLNVIVGPNGSGKTNLLESIKLAFDCVNYRGPTDYPFVPFWGYNNAVYRSESRRNIHFKFESSQNYTVLDESRSIFAVDIYHSFFGNETRKERSYDLFEIHTNPVNDKIAYMRGIPIVLPIYIEILNNRNHKRIPLLDVYDFFRNDPLYLFSHLGSSRSTAKVKKKIYPAH